VRRVGITDAKIWVIVLAKQTQQPLRTPSFHPIDHPRCDLEQPNSYRSTYHCQTPQSGGYMGWKRWLVEGSAV
jgi:hypothetical protein